MKKYFIKSLMLSVVLVAITLPFNSTNVAVDDISEINELTITNNVINEMAKIDEDVFVQEVKPIEETPILLASRGDSVTEETEITLSFYTTLPKENGNHIVTCQGIPLKYLDDAVASNFYPLGTRIYLEKFGEVTVLDHGGRDFNNSNRLDVLVQRDKKDNGKWEDDDEYFRRVNKMGRIKVKAWIIK
jgi:3D (Asp-Asp-Asp) domain-containing protein